MSWRRYLTTALIVGLIAAAVPALAAKGPVVATAVHFDVSPPLRDLAPIARVQFRLPNREVPLHESAVPIKNNKGVDQRDALLQYHSRPFNNAGPTPPPGLVWDGTNDDDVSELLGFRIVPPDTNGDPGVDLYCQWTNLIYECFDKETGVSVFGPVPGNTPWVGFGGFCEADNDGDPIILFDHLAQRWVLTQFAIESDGHQCMAVSQTPDPTGSYYRYDFVVSPRALNDYPKMGVWPDGYYMTINEFGQGEAQAIAFERDKMLVGDPSARFVKFRVASNQTEFFFSLQPSHLEGPPPPAGTCNTFIMAFDDETWGAGGGPDGYRLWDFCSDWANDQWSFTSLGQVNSSADFDSELCNFASCVPQPAPGERLATLSQFTMYRAQYRNFSGGARPEFQGSVATGDRSTLGFTRPGTASSATLLINHTVDVGGNRAGVRWAELRNDGAGWSLYQDGTYAPDDGQHRWMGSIAMDKDGDIALGYSLSSATTFPSIRYTSRQAADPLGTMPGGEVEMQAGTGAQTSSANRWGDYSAMSVDPIDDCTFYYTTEYYETTGSFDWKTAIGKFKFDSCSPQQCEMAVVVDNELIQKGLPVRAGTVLPLDIELIHRFKQVQRHFRIGILDRDTHIVTSKVTGEYTFEYGRTLNTRESIHVPFGTKPGRYLLVVGIDDMKQGHVAWRLPFRVR